MSFPRYPKYKDSGVEWLGEVPEHWKTSPLKAVSTHNDDVLDESTAPDAELAYVDISSVDAVHGIKSKETVLFSAAPSRARRRVRHGDVIVSTVRTYLKAIARIRDPEENLIVSTGFAVIRPRAELTPDFLGCLVSAGYFVEQVIARSTGVSYPAINASELVAIPVPVPPIAEQAQIAAFLDRETAKIDELVGEQRRLMELLKEKRQAVISQAVTQGFNPNAPMKPSGIEWLGDVPAHWEVSPLKRFAEVIDCRHYTVAFLDEGLPIVSIRELRDDQIDLSNAKLTSQSEWNFLREGRTPRRGDMIFCRNASVGAIGYVDFDEPFCMGQDVCLIRPDTTGRFMHYQLASSLVRSQIEAFLVGATIRRANVEEIRNLVVVHPPANEQQSIAAFLDTETDKLDTLTAEAQRAIDLLQERHTALISAAVTGQIDVRPH